MTEQKRDGYDEAIAYLRERVENDPGSSIVIFYDAWATPELDRGGILFDYTGWIGNGELCGCLTQVRAASEPCGVPELEREIVHDERIPESYEEITLESLPVFAEWQRRLDKELGRPAPVWNEELGEWERK